MWGKTVAPRLIAVSRALHHRNPNQPWPCLVLVSRSLPSSSAGPRRPSLLRPCVACAPSAPVLRPPPRLMPRLPRLPPCPRRRAATTSSRCARLTRSWPPCLTGAARPMLAAGRSQWQQQQQRRPVRPMCCRRGFQCDGGDGVVGQPCSALPSHMHMPKICSVLMLLPPLSLTSADAAAAALDCC